MNPDTLLQLSSLERRFGSFLAVDKIDFEVKRGEIFALLGPNGAGKTTTMRMITGTLQADAGKAEIGGHDCFTERHLCMRETGYVPDEPSFPPFLRAGELIRFQGEMHGLDAATISAKAGPLVKRLGLEEVSHEFAVNFSKGMKKKLAVVLALIHSPRLLILDEPTNGLDPYATRELHEIMKELRAAGCAVLFSTHLLDQAERLSDRLAIISQGRIAVIGTLAELRNGSDSGLEELFFLYTGSAPTAGVVE